MNEGIRSDHGEEQGNEERGDPQRDSSGRLSGDEREHGGSSHSRGSDSAHQPDDGGVEVSGHQHFERNAERNHEVIEHLSPTDPQLPLIPLAQTRITSYEYRGPIPDPAMLARYNEVDPTFADRIMKMAEAEVHARTESMRDLSSAEATAVR